MKIKITVKDIVNLCNDCNIVNLYKNSVLQQYDENSLNLEVENYSITVCNVGYKLNINLK